MTARGQPDQSRAARLILKDYVNGKLLFAHAPPGYNQEEFHTFAPRVRAEKTEDKLPSQQQRAMRVSFSKKKKKKLRNHSQNLKIIKIVLFRSQINRTQTTQEVDKNFFVESPRVAHIKGKTYLQHVRGLARENEEVSASGSTQSLNNVHMIEKPWRHQKKEKKEKLRRKFAHLDQH